MPFPDSKVVFISEPFAIKLTGLLLLTSDVTTNKLYGPKALCGEQRLLVMQSHSYCIVITLRDTCKSHDVKGSSYHYAVIS